jgi:hypothetical protein
MLATGSPLVLAPEATIHAERVLKASTARRSPGRTIYPHNAQLRAAVEALKPADIYEARATHVRQLIDPTGATWQK